MNWIKYEKWFWYRFWNVLLHTFWPVRVIGSSGLRRATCGEVWDLAGFWRERQ